MFQQVLMYGVAAAAITGAVPIAGFASPFVLSVFADDDFLYTKIAPGEGKMIVAGKSFHDFIISDAGRHLNRPDAPYFDEHERPWEVLNNDPDALPGYYEDRKPWEVKFGLFWVGIPVQRSIYKYHFVWSEPGKTPTGQKCTKTRDVKTDKFLLKSFAYVMTFDKLITSDGVQVTVEILSSLRISNPFIALNSKDKWYDQIEGVIESFVRSFVGQFTYKQLRSETDEKGAKARARENFGAEMKDLNYRLMSEVGRPEEECNGTKGAIGITIVGADLQQVIGTGPLAAEIEKTILLELVAPAQAQAKRTAADAQAYEIKTIGEANAGAIKAKVLAEAAGVDALIAAYKKNESIAGKLIAGNAMKADGAGKMVVLGAPDILEKVIAGVASAAGKK